MDHQSLEDEAVTVRDRDTWEQERVKVSDLAEHLQKRLKPYPVATPEVILMLCRLLRNAINKLKLGCCSSRKIRWSCRRQRLKTARCWSSLIKFKPYIPELLEALRAGTIAEPVPVMLDGSTFAIHGATRTFWVKLWHAAGSEMTKIDRAQVISCLPSTRGVQVVVDRPKRE